MNKISYKSHALIEGPHNAFKLAWGTGPSFGFFRCTASTLELIKAAGPGTLKFTDDARTVTLQNIYFVKSTEDPETRMHDIVLADKRILWQHKYGEADYNTYKGARILSDGDYEIENLNNDTPWTYAGVISDLNVGAVLTPFQSLSREPRNLRGIGRSISEILQQLMFEMNSFLILDPVADSFKILPIGQIISGDSAALDLLAPVIHIRREISSAELWKPENVRVFYGSPIEGRFESLVEVVNGGEIGDRGVITNYTDSTIGLMFAQQFAQDLAKEYQFATLWHDTTYTGIRSVTPSTMAHTITWTSNARGAFTRVTREFPFSQPPQIASQLFAFNGHALDPGEAMGQHQWQKHTMVSGNQDGWDDDRFTAILEDA